MHPNEAEASLDQLCQLYVDLVDLTKTARRNQKTLSGSNYYGRKFHDSIVAIAALEARIWPVIEGLELEAAARDGLYRTLSALKLQDLDVSRRADAARSLKLQINSVIKPRLETMMADPIPRTERVLSHSVVQGTGTIYENIVRQFNGCYERGWYDACLVMVRRFVEFLIIEVFESHKKADEIKDNQGEFQMLHVLVGKVINETTAWNLGRETKKTLPLIQRDGNRSAHARRYITKKDDVDKIVAGLRVAADDLLHLAKLK